MVGCIDLGLRRILSSRKVVPQPRVIGRKPSSTSRIFSKLRAPAGPKVSEPAQRRLGNHQRRTGLHARPQCLCGRLPSACRCWFDHANAGANPQTTPVSAAAPVPTRQPANRGRSLLRRAKFRQQPNPTRSSPRRRRVSQTRQRSTQNLQNRSHGGVARPQRQGCIRVCCDRTGRSRRGSHTQSTARPQPQETCATGGHAPPPSHAAAGQQGDAVSHERRVVPPSLHATRSHRSPPVRGNSGFNRPTML